MRHVSFRASAWRCEDVTPDDRAHVLRVLRQALSGAGVTRADLADAVDRMTRPDAVALTEWQARLLLRVRAGRRPLRTQHASTAALVRFGLLTDSGDLTPEGKTWRAPGKDA